VFDKERVKQGSRPLWLRDLSPRRNKRDHEMMESGEYNRFSREVRALMTQDSKWAVLTQQVGSCSIHFRDNRFEWFTRSIVSQYLSMRAAQPFIKDFKNSAKSLTCGHPHDFSQ